MNGDSVVIAGNAYQDTTVTSRMNFRDTFSTGRNINTGLDALTTSYITGSHFKVGYGGFGGQSENARAFEKPGNGGGPQPLSQDRIKFFKDTHFNHQDASRPSVKATSMTASFYPQDHSGRKAINDGNNAYSLRHKVHDNGKIGT